MVLDNARKICKRINEELENYNSYAKIVPSDKEYDINIIVVGNEDLPERLQKYKFVSETLIDTPYGSAEIDKIDKNTPSGPGKWIDMPASPANRTYDGPGAGGQRRRVPSLQDTVSRYAAGGSMNRIAQKLVKIAFDGQKRQEVI